MKNVYARANGGLRTETMNPSYLFSGPLKCTECGANLTILLGEGAGIKPVKLMAAHRVIADGAVFKIEQTRPWGWRLEFTAHFK